MFGCLIALSRRKIFLHLRTLYKSIIIPRICPLANRTLLLADIIALIARISKCLNLGFPFELACIIDSKTSSSFALQLHTSSRKIEDHLIQNFDVKHFQHPRRDRNLCRTHESGGYVTNLGQITSSNTATLGTKNSNVGVTSGCESISVGQGTSYITKT